MKNEIGKIKVKNKTDIKVLLFNKLYQKVYKYIYVNTYINQ